MPTAVQMRSEVLDCRLAAGGSDCLLKTRVADIAPTASVVFDS